MTVSGLDGYSPPPTGLEGVFLYEGPSGLVVDGHIWYDDLPELIQALKNVYKERGRDA